MTHWPRTIGMALVLLAVGPPGDGAAWRLEVIGPNGRVIWNAPVESNERFDLAFTHSSERCRWTHQYLVDPLGRVRQTGSVFPCYGAGMPAVSSDGSRVYRSREGFQVATPLTLGAIRMLNWQPAAITLHHRGRSWPLGRHLPDYAPFVVRAR